MASTNERPSVSIERSEKRKVIIENPNEVGCRGSTTAPATIVDERENSTVITMRPPRWFLQVKEGVKTHQPETKKHTLRRVPTFMRDIHKKNKGCFDPMVVSIGPFHLGKKGLEEMEKLKESIAKEFIISQDIEKLYQFDEVARNARQCYFYNDTTGKYYDDDQFTRMMFLDGCFILYFIYCIDDKKLNDMNLKACQRAFISRDLFLLENQLPFSVLEALMNLFKDGTSQWEHRIQKFITEGSLFGRNESWKKMKNDDWRQADHLLDLLHKMLITGVGDENESPKKTGCCLFIDKFLVNVEQMLSRRDPKNDWHSFRSVTELIISGIRFKKSHRKSLQDVKFELHFCFGDVFLPQLIVDDFTRARILNLVAYEACPDSPCDSLVTSYVCFLDALIDNAEDVKELRSKHILNNLLGSDQEVAELFNELATNLVSRRSTYDDVKDSIEKYYKTKRFKWAREFWSTHFRSPWSFLAFFFAALVIVLTIVQTYYTVRPSKGGEEDQRTPTPSLRKIHYS